MFYLPDSWLIDINNKERILSFVDEYYFSDIIIIGFNDDRDEKLIALLEELKEYKLLDKFMRHEIVFPNA
jgi:hypothetical protein